MRIVTLVLLIAGLSSTAGAARAADAEHGRELAQRHCARCHVVGDFNPMGGIGSTPSLQWIKKLDDWRERFETFYARRPHLAFLRVEGIEPITTLPPNATPIDLTMQDAEDIYAYVETLEVPGGDSRVRARRREHQDILSPRPSGAASDTSR